MCINQLKWNKYIAEFHAFSLQQIARIKCYWTYIWMELVNHNILSLLYIYIRSTESLAKSMINWLKNCVAGYLNHYFEKYNLQNVKSMGALQQNQETIWFSKFIIFYIFYRCNRTIIQWWNILKKKIKKKIRRFIRILVLFRGFYNKYAVNDNKCI